VTPEELTRLVVELDAIDYASRKGRNRAREILEQLESVPNIPPQVEATVRHAEAKLRARRNDVEPPAPPPSQQMDPATAAAGGTLPPGVGLEDFAGQIFGGGQVGFYGVPDETRDEEGMVVPWEAIVGNESVAPRYPTGWSLQPDRFGLTNAESIARAQILMEDAGLLQPGSYRPGVWDVRTAGRSNEEGWRAVLSFANVTGQSWEESFYRVY
jgi:hypothetical protein